MKRYWEIIADNLSKAGWSLGWVSAIDSNGRTIWSAPEDRSITINDPFSPRNRFVAFLPSAVVDVVMAIR